MRKRNTNQWGFWCVMIVVTLSSWQPTLALQSPTNSDNGAVTLLEQDLPDASGTLQLQEPGVTQVEPLPPPDDEKPELLIEDRFAGWQAAGTGTKVARLADTLRANWVMVDDNGLLTGQVLGLRSAEEIAKDRQARRSDNQQCCRNSSHSPYDSQYGETGWPGDNTDQRGRCCGQRGEGDGNFDLPQGTYVYLLQRGHLLGTTRLDSDNRFRFQGVKSGNYALVGYGEGGFFAFGFNVIPFAENSTQPTELYIPAIAATGETITGWVTQVAPDVHFRQFGKFRFAQGKDDPPRLYGVSGLRTFTPDAEPATSIVSHPAGLSEDGRLIGRLHNINSYDGRPLDLRTTTVQLVKEGRLAQQTGTDNYGVFEFRDVEPGSYELRATGPDGIGAVQIEVVAAGDPKGRVIDVALTSPETIGWLNHFMHERAYFEAIAGPRPQSQCDRCGQRRCSHCGGCQCQSNACHCGYGYGGGYGGYGSGYGGGYGLNDWFGGWNSGFNSGSGYGSGYGGGYYNY